MAKKKIEEKEDLLRIEKVLRKKNRQLKGGKVIRKRHDTV